MPLFLATARPAVIALFVLLALVGGPGSILYLWPMLSDKNQRPAFAPFELPGVDNWRQVALPAVILVVVFALAILADGRAFYGIFALSFLLLVAAAALSGEGWLDRERGELHSDTTISLASLAGIRPLRLGDVTLCYLSYESGASRLISPRLIAVPTVLFDELHSHLESAVAESAPDREQPDRLVQVILLAFAVFFYATGAFFWFVTDAVPTSTRLYIVGVVALLGSLFVLVVVFEV